MNPISLQVSKEKMICWDYRKFV